MGNFQKFDVIYPKSGAWLLLACALAFSGCKKEEDAPPPLPRVVTGSPSVQDVPVWQEWIASVTGVVNASILPQVSGYVLSQDYKNGVFVKKGDLLFSIDPAIFKAQLAQAQARMDQAKAQWKQADYDQNLYKPLAAENVVSKQKYEDALLSSQAALADIAAAEAAVSQATLNLSYTKLVSPIDGIAGIATVQVGDLVSPSGKVMTQVSSMNPIQIDFAVTQREWLQNSKVIKPGAEVTIMLSDRETYPAKAVVSSIGREFAYDTGTIGVQATVENGKSILRPGMFVRVKALVDTIEKALVVPQKAIYSTQGRFFVVVVGEDSKAEVVPVSTGPTVGINQVIVPVEANTVNEQSLVVVDGVQEAMMAASRGLHVKEMDSEKSKQ